jgi:cell division protein FtsI (penicillin-binding protein 3)
MAQKMTNTQDGKHRVSKTLWTVYCFFLAASIFIIGRIIFLQYAWEPDQKTLKYFTPENRQETINPERGTITDCNGQILAISTPLYTIHMDCHILKKDLLKGKVKVGRDSISERDWRKMAMDMCRQLPAIIQDGRTAEDYYSLIEENRNSNTKKGRRNVLIVKGIDHSTLLKVRQLPLYRHGRYVSGMKESKEEARKYPFGELGKRIIGDIRIDPDNPSRNRFVGIEGQYNHILHGKEGLQWMKETDKGVVVNPDSNIVKVVNGDDIRTTIDIDIQDIADKALRRYITDDEGIEGGCAVVMDVRTGAVRAMANLKKNSKDELGEYMNMAIGRPGEPGSIFKTATLMTLLEDGKVTLSTEVATNNGILKEFPKVAKDRALIKYESETKKNSISVREGFKRSSNNVFRHLVIKHYGEEKNRKQFTDRLFEYKLHDAYDFDLEEKGYGKSDLRKSWSIHDLYSTAIGYSIRETPLNMLAFYNAIANKGKMMKPYIIDSHIRNGKAIRRFEPEILNASICSKATIDTLTAALKAVASEGTARRLKGAKCEVAGKTGTSRSVLDASEKPLPKDHYLTENGERKYQATFVGFFPADEPKYSAIVTVYTKLTKSDAYGGGNHPTRIFREIVDNIWALDPEWGKVLSESGEIPEMTAEYIGTRKDSGVVPDLKGMGLMDAIYAIENNGFRCSYEGVGHVIRQTPNASARCSKGETIKIVLR